MRRPTGRGKPGSGMRRCEFITLLGGAAAATRSVWSVQSVNLYYPYGARAFLQTIDRKSRHRCKSRFYASLSTVPNKPLEFGGNCFEGTREEKGQQCFL